MLYWNWSIVRTFLISSGVRFTQLSKTQRKQDQMSFKRYLDANIVTSHFQLGSVYQTLTLCALTIGLQVEQG